MMRAVQVERQEMLSRLVSQESAHEASGIAGPEIVRPLRRGPMYRAVTSRT